MGGTISTKNEQLDYLQKRFELLASVIDGMDAESANVEELDSILKMIDDIEVKVKQFRRDWPNA
ncbi:SE1561 family protein [Shouchella sp. 1P09AA]|uniref:SE1561 family protein n=1 Tax=unclassified Shouchella TaxID=2893065 RepID=UPI0039A3A135